MFCIYTAKRARLVSRLRQISTVLPTALAALIKVLS